MAKTHISLSFVPCYLQICTSVHTAIKFILQFALFTYSIMYKLMLTFIRRNSSNHCICLALQFSRLAAGASPRGATNLTEAQFSFVCWVFWSACLIGSTFPKNVLSLRLSCEEVVANTTREWQRVSKMDTVQLEFWENGKRHDKGRVALLKVKTRGFGLKMVNLNNSRVQTRNLYLSVCDCTRSDANLCESIYHFPYSCSRVVKPRWRIDLELWSVWSLVHVTHLQSTKNLQ